MRLTLCYSGGHAAIYVGRHLKLTSPDGIVAVDVLKIIHDHMFIMGALTEFDVKYIEMDQDTYNYPIDLDELEQTLPHTASYL